MFKYLNVYLIYTVAGNLSALGKWYRLDNNVHFIGVLSGSDEMVLARILKLLLQVQVEGCWSCKISSSHIEFCRCRIESTHICMLFSAVEDLLPQQEGENGENLALGFSTLFKPSDEALRIFTVLQASNLRANSCFTFGLQYACQGQNKYIPQQVWAAWVCRIRHVFL